MQKNVALYAGVGPVLVHYRMDVDNFTLQRASELTLACNVQSGWLHPNLPVIYVGASSRKNMKLRGSEHMVYAFAIDRETGALIPLGSPVVFPQRPVYMTCDGAGKHLVVALPYGDLGLVVVRLQEDGSLGDFVEQRPGVDAGIHPHQVRVTPDDRYCISVARGRPADWPDFGWWADKSRQKEPGSINVIDYRDGVFGKQTSIKIGDGYEFGSRHLDFHPSGPWVYVQLETQNEVVVYRRDESGLSPNPLQRLCTLERPDDILVRQMLGTVRVHPRGHAVYLANRSHEPIPQRNGTDLILKDASENSLVVYAIDGETGLLTQIQRIDSGGISPRDFGLDPGGRMLVVANCKGHWMKDGKHVGWQPRNLSTFRVFPDGRLERKHRYEEPVPGEEIRWARVVCY